MIKLECVYAVRFESFHKDHTRSYHWVLEGRAAAKTSSDIIKIADWIKDKLNDEGSGCSRVNVIEINLLSTKWVWK